MADCIYLNLILKELNPADSNSGPCCAWNMVECDNTQNIVKLDFSNYAIQREMTFPQTLLYLTHLKEFSLKGQKNIYDIYSIDVTSLEKLDLSNTGLNSTTFPKWISDAKNLKELDLTNTKINAVPQIKFNSNDLLTKCSITNTPICSIYQNNSFDFLPKLCKDSCSDKVPVNGNTNDSSDSSSSSWPYILIGVVVLIVLILAGGYFYMRSRKNKNEDKYEDYNSNPKPIPIAKKPKEDHNTSVNNNDKIINIDPQPKSQKMEEVARNNYTNAYGGDVTHQSIEHDKASYASVKDIYRQHNASNNSLNHERKSSQQSQQQYNSIYNSISNDDSLNNSQDEEIISNEIIGAGAVAAAAATAITIKDDDNNNHDKKNEPELLRRKSSKKSVSSHANSQSTQSSSNENLIPTNEKVELYMANWDYEPTLSDELTLMAGDIIEIRKIFDDGWSTGLNRRTQKTGIIPMCYLKPY